MDDGVSFPPNTSLEILIKTVRSAITSSRSRLGRACSRLRGSSCRTSTAQGTIFIHKSGTETIPKQSSFSRLSLAANAYFSSGGSEASSTIGILGTLFPLSPSSSPSRGFRTSSTWRHARKVREAWSVLASLSYFLADFPYTITSNLYFGAPRKTWGLKLDDFKK